MRRALLWLVGVVVALGVVGAVVVRRSTTVQDAIMRRMVASRVGTGHPELLQKDALRVVLCGTGSPLPDPDRAQACTAVFAGGRFFLIDAGVGSWERLARFHLPAERLDDVLLTHFHSDHIAGLPDVMLNTWAAGRHVPLRIWGGPGVDTVADGFHTAMSLDDGYRQAHHGTELLPTSGAEVTPKPIVIPAGSDSTLVLDEDGVRITAFRVEHTPVEPAYGYRVDYGGRAVVVSGDTAPTPTIVAAAKGADVLIHEALAPHMIATIVAELDAAGDHQRARIMKDVPSYHTGVVDAAREANEARVPLLVLSHLVPSPPKGLAERIFMRGVADVRPDGTVLGWDGLMVELPVQSKEIRQRAIE
jgi:ribonuclease Z